MTETQLETKSEFEPWPKEKDEQAELKAMKGELLKEKDEQAELKEQQELKLKIEKADKDENEFLAPNVKFQVEGGPDEIKNMLVQHAEALEDAARTLRHFIAQQERPDLKHGALRNEPDAQ